MKNKDAQLIWESYNENTSQEDFDRQSRAMDVATRSLIDVVHTLYGQIEPAPDIDHVLELIGDMLRGTNAELPDRGHAGVYSAVVKMYPAKPSVDQAKNPYGAMTGDGPASEG